ncbi:MAG: thioredoxin family protein [Campylobacterota bacterium]|nr:thioredoxin family protein [Campylobacterota bacterium]
MKRLLFSIVSLFVLSISLNAQGLKHTTSYKQGLNDALAQNKPMVIFMYGKNCPWCSRMEQTTFSNKNVVELLNKNFIFIAINQNRNDYPKKFIPKGVPTTYIVDPKSERILNTLMGYKDSKSFLEILKL